jgi:signal transduction histidine kinase
MTEPSTTSTEAKPVYCPECSHRLAATARVCPNCGVDLALLALLAERAYLEGLPEAAPIAQTPEALVPRIGEYLINQGVLDQGQLEAALSHQSQLAEQGKRRLLGQTLIELGYIDSETLDKAVTRQIIELHAALQEINRNLENRVSERTAELRRALERLTELNQIKANLISNVSHELRTPLAHIRGYLELIEEQELGSLNEQQLNAVNVIHRATDRLERLITDLIEFSTASREGINLNLSRVDLCEVAQDAIKRSEEKAEKAGVKLELRRENGSFIVRADQEKIGWVMYQLVDNGIKFTPADGNVVLILSDSDDLIAVAVRDTGIGFEKERIEEIFEPFHQLDGSPTRRYGGTGLGLALVKQILVSHGAPLQVQSAPGEGTTFKFTLPREGESQ